MNSIANILSDSLFFGMAVSLLCYGLGMLIKKKTKLALANPILIGVILVIVFLKCTGVDYDVYMSGAKYLSYLLTPATICLAVPLYEKLQLLKENAAAVAAGILSGVITSALTVWAVCLIFTLEDSVFATMLPKSITTAIGMAVSEELGGVVNITVAIIIITGIVGNVVADIIFKLFKINEPIARGLALGTSAHVLGTSKALELGDTEGAMSGLAVAVSGIITVLVAPMLVGLY